MREPFAARATTRAAVARSAGFTPNIDPADEGRGTDLGTLILDEILQHRDGCSHEIACWDGTLTIVCHDLQATWTETTCSSTT
ncbi:MULTISPECIES: hypothetical protein [Streptomyces]|uniref:ATP-binding protein n=1 Tax=Streptomyces changanensis TaxID=2964669 RepID=A0ABY5NG79_9ACTN|nr:MULTISPECIES: hypothetical protein [Streptomyces]UUS35054.1 hypothetical protein NRO40_00015 [Streptomyces changanensis]